jgi:hypothetical protein
MEMPAGGMNNTFDNQVVDEKNWQPCAKELLTSAIR